MTDDLHLSDLPTPEFEGTLAPADLHTDGDNPNEMTDAQFGLLCDRMRQNGWLGGPIITDTDGLIADGEHRWRAAQEIGLAEVPVRQYALDDATRRLWRQELNKIHGDHDPKRDALEYDYLLSNGKTDEVNALVDAADEDLDELLAELRMDSGVGPAYEYDPDHTVYFEDCVEGMRERLDEGEVDLFVTDPPYAENGEGIGVQSSDGSVGEGELAETTAYPEFEGNTDEFDFEEVWSIMQQKGNSHIIFGGNYFADILPPTNQWVIWDKRAGSQNIYSDAELAWTNTGEPVRIFEHMWQGMLRKGGEDRDHPTQKPVELVAKLIREHTTPESLVCDPFMGSGTTAVAAIQTGRDYIGFEIDETWRDVIERRIGEAKRQRDASVNADTDT
jgi:hypothetical protein